LQKHDNQLYVQELLAAGKVQGDFLFIDLDLANNIKARFGQAPAAVTEKKCCHPPILQQARNFVGALGRAAQTKLAQKPLKRSAEEIEALLAICHGCDQYDKDKARCFKCGCYVRWKTMLTSERCPLNKW
jgi:hypothetical protein